MKPILDTQRLPNQQAAALNEEQHKSFHPFDGTFVLCT